MAEHHTIGEAALRETYTQVTDSTGYRSQYIDRSFPQASRFVRAMEDNLQRLGASLIETSDPDHAVEQRQILPKGDWPYSIWSCPDGSVAAVFESRAEIASDSEHVMNYTLSRSKTAKTIGYAGHWDGQRADELAHMLQKAVARIHGGNYGVTMMEAAPILNGLRIPFTDRIPENHPLKVMGDINGIDVKGDIALSSDELGPFFVTPTNPDALHRALQRALAAAEDAGSAGPLAKSFQAHHMQQADFYEAAEIAMREHPELVIAQEQRGPESGLSLG
jgi:hypothetical protein